uniref:Leucine-rich repeat-containing protein DDB_G0290503 n=1 Tax=Syphacia muris TaxID=451379 RepID=A0A0N5A912_9BILA
MVFAFYKRKLEMDHLNEQLKMKHEKEMNKKDEELNKLKVRYARCIDSFEILRRYQEAPESVFDAIHAYLKCDCKHREVPQSCSSSATNYAECGLPSQSLVSEGAQNLAEKSKEDEENLDAEISKAGYNAIRKRLSMDPMNSSGKSVKSATQIKKERRMTRFTMGTSSYNRHSGDTILQTTLENENGLKDPFEELQEVDINDWESEKLKLECENNRLIQINEEFEEQLLSLNKEKNELLVKNEQLLENVQKVEAKLLAVIEEKENAKIQGNEELDKSRQMCKKVQLENEMHWEQICSLNMEKTDLVRKTDELKEIIESLEGDKALSKLDVADKEKENMQLNEKLQELQKKWDFLHQEIFRSVTDVLTPEVNSLESCKRRCSNFADASEAINRVKEYVESKNEKIAKMEEKINNLEEELTSMRKDYDIVDNYSGDLEHENNSKVKRLRSRRKQYSDSKAHVPQLEKEAVLEEVNKTTEEPRTNVVTRSRASRRRAK